MGRIVKKKLSDSVLEELGRMVEAGELKRGDKLPPQDQLAAQLGVSRPSLREALRAMASHIDDIISGLKTYYGGNGQECSDERSEV
ncbi:MAG: FadR family transcriptional regulator [Desulfobacterales bacterium]|nr:FadR family transcriptional regulator [Desulfobacterales bacterium]